MPLQNKNMQNKAHPNQAEPSQAQPNLAQPGVALPGAKKTWLAKAFNTSVLEKSRLAWVDYLRGIAIVLVVYRHVLLGLQRGDLAIPVALVNANMIFYSFRMPLFFILSGIFISSSIAKRPLKKLIYIKFENLLYPYLIWVFIQVTLQILLSRYTNTERTLRDYTFILYDPKLLDQFWYLPALFNATIAYLLIKTKLHAPNWLQLILGLVFYLLSPHIHQFSMLSDWMKFYIFFALGDIMSVQFFNPRSQSFLKSPWTLLLITPIFVLTQIYYLHLPRDPYGEVPQIPFLLIALIGCLSMFVLSFRLQSLNILRFLRVLGFHSLFIYVMHVLVAAFVRVLLTKYFGLHNAEILLICGILAALTIPIIFYNTLVKDNILWFLFSLKKPSKRHSKTPTKGSPDPSVAQ
jgi:fucose 4-O-acetylase-like acetyltransferase